MGIPWSCHIFKLRDNLCEVVRTETRVQKSGSTTAQIDVSTRVIHFKLRSFLRSGKMELNKRPRYCLSGQTQSRLKFIIQSAFLCVCLSE